MEAELARRNKLRLRERLETDFAAFAREAWPVLEPTKPMVWGWPLQTVADHAQALVEDWIRIQLASIKVLKPVPTSPLPAAGPERDAEAVRRQHLENCWREAKRLGVLEEGGRIRRIEQRFRKLLVNIPPGYAKSRMLSVMLPAWAWLRWPSMSWFALSTNPDVALRDADFCRDLVKSPWYRGLFEPWWVFSATQDAKGRYANSAGGWRLSKGWQANAVGDRADAQILDDANDPDKAFSEADRKGVNERWDNTLESRVNAPDTSIRFGVQQRVHPEDWSNHVLQEGDWEHLLIQQEKEAKVPCVCTSCARGETALGWKDPRAPGELALPERFGPTYVAAQKKKSLRWAAQHQQNPQASAGNMFKQGWWRFWRWPWEEDVPDFKDRTVVLDEKGISRWVASIDASFKGKEDNDFVAAGLWAARGPDRFLVDLVWRQMGFVDTLEALRETFDKARWAKAREKLIEDKANGPAIIDTLSREISGIIPVDPQGGKEARAAATSPQVEAGNVFIPLHAEWRDRYIEEHSSFPRGAHDDAVDQQSQALLRMAEESAAEKLKRAMRNR